MNCKKSEALGMSWGAANNRLRKKIMYSLICQLGLNVCYQCGREVISIDHLSVEHKEPWLAAKNPVESFFDLDNIAFSHLSCNIAAGRKPHKKYETVSDRNRAKRKRWRARRTAEELKTIRRDWYERYGC